MTTTESIKLGHLYDTQIQSAHNLMKLLADEETALRKRDTQTVSDYTVKKQQLLEEFESNEQERKKLYANLEKPVIGSISQKHETLKISLASLQQQNRINGGILTVSQEFTQQMLDIIRGIGRNQSTYDAFGKSLSSSEAQPLAKV